MVFLKQAAKRIADLDALAAAKSSRKSAKERVRSVLGDRDKDDDDDDDDYDNHDDESGGGPDRGDGGKRRAASPRSSPRKKGVWEDDSDGESDEFSMIRGMGNFGGGSSSKGRGGGGGGGGGGGTGGAGGSSSKRAGGGSSSRGDRGDFGSPPNSASKAERRYLGSGDGGKTKQKIMPGDEDDWKLRKGNFSGRGGKVISSKNLVVCPICFQQLKEYVPGKEAGQQIDACEHQDPMNVLEKRIDLQVRFDLSAVLFSKKDRWMGQDPAVQNIISLGLTTLR